MEPRGDLEVGITLTGQVAGRIKEVKPMAQIFAYTMAEFDAVVGKPGALRG